MAREKGSLIKQCEYCGRDFGHDMYYCVTKQQRFCSKDCRNNYQSEATRNGKWMACEKCGKMVYRPINHLKRIKHIFCSLRCANQRPVPKRRVERITIECRNCGTPLERTKREINRSQSLGSFCNNACLAEYRKNRVFSLCETCGVITESKKSIALRFCSPSCASRRPENIEQLAGMLKMQLRNKGPTNLELKGRDILMEMDISFEEQTHVGRFVVDVLLENMIIIEWDGDYWHGHPTMKPYDNRQKKTIQKDKTKNKYLERCGYRVLHFWESDVNNRPEYVKDIIEKELGSPI